jgi:hypothetical protein
MATPKKVIASLGLEPDASTEEICLAILRLKEVKTQRSAKWTPKVDNVGRVYLYGTGVRFFAEDLEGLREALAGNEIDEFVVENATGLSTRDEYNQGMKDKRVEAEAKAKAEAKAEAESF